MKLNELIKISKKTKKRVARGIGSGKGKTAGRGTKGQNARSGGGVRIGFEGGQMPLTQRVPKRKGFKSRNSKPQTVNLSDLESFSKKKVTKDDFLVKGIIKDSKRPVKLLSKGDVKKAFEVHVDKASSEAKKKIEKKGGKVITEKK